MGRLRAEGCVFAEEEAALLVAAAASMADLEAMAVRRMSGEPLEQVLGWADLAGTRVRLAPGVFVPRQRTALLVREAASVLGAQPGTPVLVDLCCGSGAVGLAVARTGRTVVLHATDRDPVAVRCARENLAGYGRVHQGDLWQALPDRLAGLVDVAVCVPPYVPSEEIGRLPREAREHEPAGSLDGGADGLDVLRRVVVAAAGWLRPGGHLLLEVGEPQVEAAVAALARGGLLPRVAREAESGAVVVAGRAQGPTTTAPPGGTST